MKKVFTLLTGFLLLVQAILVVVPANAATSVRYHKALCPATASGTAHCYARVTVDSSGKPLATTGYSAGLTPADLVSAYKLPAPPSGTFAWNGQTVAIVDAYDNPHAVADLAVYRKQFGLPLCSDGSASCILSKVGQSGTATLPSASSSWGQEINLDVQMAAAACPACKILLVEATSASIANLGTAVDTAARLGATAISNSYGGSEFATETTAQSHYNHPGIAVTVSSGDSGYGVEFPAASQYVTAVGGTTLTRTSGGRGWTESAWRGAGSGCSKYIPAPSWQTAIGSCNKRIVADVSSVADPATGMAMYDSYGTSRNANWFVVGGTSAAAPFVAGLYAAAKASNHQSFTYGELPYTHRSSLFDVSSGKNGTCSTTLKALCTAVAGYDGPTGLGTANGLGAF